MYSYESKLLPFAKLPIGDVDPWKPAIYPEAQVLLFTGVPVSIGLPAGWESEEVILGLARCPAQLQGVEVDGDHWGPGEL